MPALKTTDPPNSPESGQLVSRVNWDALPVFVRPGFQVSEHANPVDTMLKDLASPRSRRAYLSRLNQVGQILSPPLVAQGHCSYRSTRVGWWCTTGAGSRIKPSLRLSAPMKSRPWGPTHVDQVFVIAGRVGIDDFDTLVRIYVRLYACTVLHEYGHSTLGDPRGEDVANSGVPAAWLPNPNMPDILEETRNAYIEIFGEEPVGFLNAISEFPGGPLSPRLLQIFKEHRDTFETVISAANAQSNTGGTAPIVRIPDNNPRP